MRNNDPFSDLIRSIEENLERNGGWVPPEQEEPRPIPQGRPGRLWWFIIPILFLLLFNFLLGFATDWAWFSSVGYQSVLMTWFGASVALFVAGALFCWLFIAVNVLIARRLEPFGLIGTPPEQIAGLFGVRVPFVILLAAAAFSAFMGLVLAADWQQVLLFLNQTPFEVTDPLFGQNVAFYVFTLPAWELIRGWLFLVVAASVVAVAVTAGVGWRGWDVKRPILVHMAVLGALLLLLIAWEYRLDAYALVYKGHGVVFGAGYTDVHARLPVYNLLAIVTGVAAVLLVVVAALRRGWRAIVGVLVVWVAVALVAGAIYPAFVQRFQVDPNELNLERPYIEDNIEYSRYAYGLDKFQVSSYAADREMTPATLLEGPETVRNVRLWDYRPLLQTYNQIQALLQYYEFYDVDVDRYVIDDQITQVMVAAREMAPERLNADAQTWVNLKLVYTHGYGVAISPSAEVTQDGLPKFFAKDLPVQGVIEVKQPQVYFGEITNDYVIGRTSSEEFDYPQGSGYAGTRFSADTGIAMSWWHRLLFAIRFADINLLLSSDIQPDSQLLWRRNIVERVEEIAPFLRLDSDPYIAVGDDGKLYWYLDAYVMNGQFPYSEPFRDRFNYIRNSVKIIVDAYTGQTTFYVVDEKEPITATYRRIFPSLFKPISELPVFLAGHIRYPTDLYSVQAEMFRTYHMTNPNNFYNKDDVWAWPQEMFYNEPQPVQPYYVLMQLPGSDRIDYVQILPFTPANRDNMVAWMAAQSTLDKYGEIVVYEFGSDSLFFGPQQIEARIDQDPAISAQLSLWNQQGSSVVRGNLLVLPIGDSLLYVEPLYLQAENGKIPELKRVVLATADQVVMGENLGQALVRLFGNDTVSRAGLADLVVAASANLPGGALPTNVQPGLGATAGDLQDASLEQLILAANQHYARAQDHIRDGDWASYGQEMNALQAVLEQLVKVTGVKLEATPTPVATPDP